MKNPADTLGRMLNLTRPGGAVVIEDNDCTGYVTYPESPAFDRYIELYITAVCKRGGDPAIGMRLPLLLKEVGFERVQMNVVQPMATEGEAKLINPITMMNISHTVIEDNLASSDEVHDLIRQLHEFADNPETIAGVPRIVQAWGYCPHV